MIAFTNALAAAQRLATISGTHANNPTELKKIVKANAEASIALLKEIDGYDGGIQPCQPRRRFERPTIEMLKLHCTKIGIPETEGELFFNFYESKGWLVGKTPMKSWVSAMAGWKSRWEQNNGRYNSTYPRNGQSHNHRLDGCAQGPNNYGAAVRERANKRAMEFQMAKAKNGSSPETPTS